MALSQKKLDFDDLINDINLAKDMLAVKCTQTIDSSELQYLEDHDHQTTRSSSGSDLTIGITRSYGSQESEGGTFVVRSM